MKLIANIIILIQFVLSFYSDTKIFYPINNFTTYLCCKALFLLILIIFWHGIFSWIASYAKNQFTRKQIQFSLIYLLIMSLLFIALWPGIWRWDEFGILNKALMLEMNYWQHFLTSIYYILSLMFFPSPASIIGIQIACISLIVGYILAYCYIRLPKSPLRHLLWIPFLLPPVIDNNFYPIRTSLYAYIELLFLFWILHKRCKKAQLKVLDITLASIATALLMNWRSECIYYILLAPILLWVALKNLTPARHIMVYLLLTLTLSGGIFVIQAKGLSENYGQRYTLTSIINPLSMMVQHPLEEDLLDNIDQVMSLDVLRENSSPYGINAYYKPSLINEDATKEDYQILKKTYLKLVMGHLDIFLKYRYETLLATSGYYPDIRINIFDSSIIFDKNENGEYLHNNYKQFSQHYLTKPFYKDIRKKLIRWLESRDISHIEVATSTYNIFYNMLYILIALVILTFYLILRKCWLVSIFTIGLLVKYGLIFVTAPSKIFMYYFPIYLSTLFLFMFAVVTIICSIYKKARISLYV